MRFYLGVHRANWIGQTRVPLFLSARILRPCKSWRRAKGPWALDSGGFSELSLYGRWVTSPRRYADETRRYTWLIGNMDWAAIQDWMCEGVMLTKTGLTVREHQKRTVASYHELRHLAPEVPWMPVLQGFHLDEYRRCAEDYAESGVDLGALPVVGLGSVCRRQATSEAAQIVRHFAGGGLKLHLFGYKLKGLVQVHHLIESSDSMAWSYGARRNAPLPGCFHKNCANCLKYALAWRGKVEELVSTKDTSE